MTIQIATLSVEGRPLGAALYDTATRRPLAMPIFASADEADAFADWAHALGFAELDRCGSHTLDRLRVHWREAGCPRVDPDNLSAALAKSLAQARVQKMVARATDVREASTDDERRKRFGGGQ